MNVQGLIETLDAIETGVVNWEQSNWCNCFAGSFLRLQGFPPYIRADVEDGYGWLALVNLPDEGEVNVSWAAQKMLGLTDYQVRLLFNGDNTIEDLRRLVGSFVQDDLAEQAQQETPEMQTA